MKKALTIVAIISGAIAYASALVLLCLSLGDIAEYFKKIKSVLTTKIQDRKYIVDDDEF